MARIKLGFSLLNVPAQIERGRNITTLMTGNTNYPTPSPTLAAVDAIIDALEVAYNESRNRDTVKMEIMRTRRAELLAIIRQLGAYVQNASLGNALVTLTSGFSVVPPRSPKPPVQQILDLRIAEG